MSSGSALTFEPTADAIQRLAESWAWLLKDAFSPVLFSAIGDMFFARDDGSIWWLNTGTAEVTRVADSLAEFREKLGTEIVDEWFLPELVARLHSAGKVPEPGECYTYIVLPIFAEGRYEVENLNPVPAAEHFVVTGNIHREIAARPEGARQKPTTH